VTTASPSTYYTLARGVDIVPVGAETVLFRSDAVAFSLEGASAVAFAERVLPLLDGSRSLVEVAETLPHIGEPELRAHLDALVDAHVLVRSVAPRPAAGFTGIAEPFHALLETMGLPRESVVARLGALHVVVFGLEGAGAHVADALARAGAGQLTLVDPFPCRTEDFAAMPAAGRAAPGASRQDVMRGMIESIGSDARVAIGPAHALEKDTIHELARGASLLVGTFDRSFSVAHQWINRASLDLGVPALYGQVHGHRAIAGPLVIPEETACYLCWRMRALACEEDFAGAMAYEEHLDARRAPRGADRPLFPSVPNYLGSVLAMEALRMSLALGTLALAGRVQEFDALTGSVTVHHVLFRPECPACKKKASAPEQPGLAAFLTAEAPGDILAAEAHLVSRRCGIVRACRPVSKDPSEPLVPHVVRAELANHRFLSGTGDEFMVASGKGFTPAEARASALGEAVERYSGSLGAGVALLHATRATLPGSALDPRRLVLYLAEQYASLKYSPYEDDATLGWVTGRSLVTGEDVFVPAIAVFMAYEARTHAEFIAPITSNGLAAGPTLASAIRSAALEVIERDAFLNMWLHQLPCVRVDAATHPEARVVDLVRAYARRRVELELYRLPMDHPVPVFAALGVQEDRAGDGPAVVVGLGADLDPGVAARRAVLEVAQVRPALRIRARSDAATTRIAELVEDPHRVESLDDHDLLYTSRAMLGAFDFLRSSQRARGPWIEPASSGLDAVADLRTIAGHLRDAGTDLIYCNLTTDDVRPFGLHTVRAIVPDFQPIHFGRGERRLGGTRLFDLPRRLGLRAGPATVADLNDLPHPLA
jgi:ribosomal protein S12 methylthiotransferase accessory factor